MNKIKKAAVYIKHEISLELNLYITDGIYSERGSQIEETILGQKEKREGTVFYINGNDEPKTQIKY